MGVGHLQQIVSKLRAAGGSAEQAVAVVERATLPEQRTLRGTLETIVATVQAANVQPPALLIVGDVTALAAGDSMMGSELGAFV
jgi:siroheme synthase